MTTLRNSLFIELYIDTVCQFISRNQRHPTKSAPIINSCTLALIVVYINQSVKRYKNAPDNILEGRPDNNYCEAERPRN